MPVTISREHDVAIVKMDNPPVNALSGGSGFLEQLTHAIKALDKDSTVKAIVIAGEGRFFSAGADIADFGDDSDHDVGPIRALMEALDRMSKPVVAAIHGIAFGGGLELALACHYRCALTGARLSFPEVTLGLLPGAGGTQRLSRLVPAETALELMLTGRQLDAVKALELGLVDKLVTADLLDRAVAEAARLAKGGWRRTRDLPVRTGRETAPAIEAARTGARPRGREQAMDGIVACVEAAVALPFDAGIAVEYQAFNELMVSEPARGLRHAFLLDRAVGKVAGLPAAAHEIDSAGVIGAGTMGVGISAALLNAGIGVTLIDRDLPTVEAARGRIGKIMDGAVARNRISADEAARRMGRLALGTQAADAGEADLFIEAVFEDLDIKRQIFQELDRVAKPEAILASNTSTLDVNQIAASVARPERVVGTHFFSPAHIMKLLEIVRPSQAAPQTVADLLGFARKIGKVGVVAGVCDGFIGNRIFEEYLRQAYWLLEEGALPMQLDRALEAWGWAMGPLRVMDLAGQDIGWKIRQRRGVEQPDRPYSKIPDLICEMGRFGQKTGAGYYLYPVGQTAPVADPVIDKLVEDQSAALGIDRRPIADEEIVWRCMAAIINEGARIVEEGVAARPLDVDAVYLHGYGFPFWRGGPMFHADRLGLPLVLERIRGYQHGPHAWAWEPSPLLVKLAEQGGSFASLNL